MPQLYRVARDEYTPLASVLGITLGRTDEANVGNPVLPNSDTGFFRAFGGTSEGQAAKTDW